MFIVSVLPVLAMFIVSFISYFQCRLRPFISPVVLAMFIVSVPDVLVCSLCQCLVFSLCSLCHSSTTFSVGYVPSFLQSFSLCSLSQCLMFSYVHCVSASCSRYVHCVTHLATFSVGYVPSFFQSFSPCSLRNFSSRSRYVDSVTHLMLPIIIRGPHHTTPRHVTSRHVSSRSQCVDYWALPSRFATHSVAVSGGQGDEQAVLRHIQRAQTTARQRWGLLG